MNFELKIALRFLREGRGQTLFILLGIAIGVAVQVFIGTLISGLQADLIGATVGNSPHITFNGKLAEDFSGSELSDFTIEGNFQKSSPELDDWQNVLLILDSDNNFTAVSPVVQGSGFLLRSGERSPIVLRGVLAERANLIYNLEDNLLSGTLQLDGNSILLGTELAKDFSLEAGDSLTIEVPGGVRQSFTVSGVFDLGNNSLNASWVFLDLSRASRLLGFGGKISAIETQIEDVFVADVLAAGYSRSFTSLRVENWKEQNSDLLVALQSQGSSTVTIQFFVLMAITLGIASVLAVSVVQKSKQIGILKAMGASSGQASRIFLYQGGILGFLGSVLGVLLGFLLTQFFLWGTSLGTGEPIFALKFSLQSSVIIILIATFASLASAFFPARRSAKLNPIDVIRG